MQQEATEEPPQVQVDDDAPVSPSKMGLGPPRSISKRLSAPTESPKEVKKTKDRSKTAMQLIRDSGGVGTDLLRATSSKRPPPSTKSLGTTFLRPSGVDGPADNVGGSTAIAQSNDAFSEARSQMKGAMKRERETVSEPNNKERKKRKKKRVVAAE